MRAAPSNGSRQQSNLDFTIRAAKLGLLPLVACTIFYGALLGAEEYAITKMDIFVTIQSIEQAEIAAISINATFEFLWLCIIGMAIRLVLRAARGEISAKVRPTLLRVWIVAALLASALVLGSNLAGYLAQFGSLAADAEGFRTLLLGLIYINVLIYYLFVRTALGAAVGNVRPMGIASAWLATGTGKSILVFLAVVAIKLAIENVAVSMLGFAPFIAPFWFIPDESEPQRYFVGQATRIVAESLALPCRRSRCSGCGFQGIR